MNQEFLTVSDALSIMRQTDQNGNPIPFDISFVTLDVTRNTGGKHKTFKKAFMTPTEIKRTTPSKTGSGSQMHYRNATRNIRSANGDMNKIHVYLITRINGKPLL